MSPLTIVSRQVLATVLWRILKFSHVTFCTRVPPYIPRSQPVKSNSASLHGGSPDDEVKVSVFGALIGAPRVRCLILRMIRGGIKIPHSRVAKNYLEMLVSYFLTVCDIISHKKPFAPAVRAMGWYTLYGEKDLLVCNGHQLCN